MYFFFFFFSFFFLMIRRPPRSTLFPLHDALPIYQTEYIGLVKRTRGTETSQYPEEKTSTEIPVVVASEPGPGQCLHFN